MEKTGKVYLVGAGPGAPGLLTCRGRECLEMADVVLFDGLANPRMLDFAKNAECICVGKHGQTRIWTQSDINQELLAQARIGRTVVRLKGGDPAVFARTAEELELLAQEEIEFEVVPGITAALAAASYVGIPITHREHASAVAFITGQQRTGGPPQDIDWQAVAGFPGTLVFYMGVTTVREWTERLLEAGKAASTPAAIIRRCTWSDQQIIRTKLGELVERLTPSTKLRPPVIVILGDVANLGKNFDWFSSKPLHGCGVLVGHTQSTIVEDMPCPHRSLVAGLERLGAEVYLQPALTVEQPTNPALLDAAIDRLVEEPASVEGITFSSRNGVDGFLRAVAERGYDSRLFHGKVLAAVGASTADRLLRYGLKCDIVPKANPSAEALLTTLQASGQAKKGSHWIVTTTNRSQGALQSGLAAMGCNVLEAQAYTTHAVTKLSEANSEAISKHRIQFCTSTSSAMAESLADALGTDREHLSPIALSPNVALTLNGIGWPAKAVAEENTDEAMVRAIESLWLSMQSEGVASGDMTA